MELTRVPIWQGPMLVTRLREAGIDARMLEAFSIVTDSTTDARIFVPRRQAADAERLL